MAYELHPSEFNNFESDFDKVNWLDTNTWSKKKIYDKKYWLVVPNFKLNIKRGDSITTLTVFLKTTGEQFGEPITPLNIGNFTVFFYCYDQNNSLIIKDTASITNESIGQVEYEFKELDFQSTGIYYGAFEFVLPSINGNPPTSLFLPSNNKIQIFVS